MEQKKLTKSEEKMMDIFWDSDTPLTSVDIIKMHIKDTWGSGLVHNILRSLVRDGLLEECGTIRYVTQYARLLKPVITREEYAAKILLSSVSGKTSLDRVILALAKENMKENHVTKEEMSALLEETARALQKEE